MGGAHVAPAAAVVAPEQRSSIVSSYGRLALSFEPNQGQANAAQFLARGRGYTLFLRSTETVLALLRGSLLPRSLHGGREPGAQVDQSGGVLRMRLAGANASAPGVAEDLLPGKSNYLIGNNRKDWRTGIPNYGRVRYRGVYPGIDVVYYGNQRLLEHDFEVAPGADPRKIRLAFEGIKGAELSPSGDLVLHVADGEVHLQKPLIYQATKEGKREIAGGYVLRGREVSFEIGDYDRRETLVIDPTLSYSTFLGGNGEDYATSLALDSGNNVYLAGYTASTNFPTTAGVVSTTCQNCFPGTDDVFVAKINSFGTALVYSTFISGSNDDEAYSIAVDGSGNAHVTGFTNSSNFPVTTGAFQTALKSFLGNAFVSVLNDTGTRLLYSTFLGGSARDYGNPMALDGSGNIYVAGESYSTDFPTLGTPISTPPPTFYVSSNGGTSFSASSSGMKSLEPLDIVVDKGAPGTLYVGTIGGGVYKSTDSGATWAQMPTPFNTGLNPAQLGGDNVTALVMDPSTTGSTAIVYAGSEFFGISRTTNGGASWAQINSGLNSGAIVSLAINPLNPATLYAGSNGRGVWVSNNANSASPTWSQMPLTGLSNKSVWALAVDPVNATVYAGTGAGVFQFSTASNSWVALTNGIPANAFIHALVIDPSSDVYAATAFAGGIFKFNPSTATWTAINGSGATAMTATDVFGLTLDPNVPTTLYAQVYGGIFKTTDGGANWTLLNNGLVTANGSRLAVDPNNSAHLYFSGFNPMSFVARFPAGGGTPLLLTQFGGVNGQTSINTIAADSLGNTYIAGFANGTLPGPVVGPQTSIAGVPHGDGFVAKISPTQTVVYSRYLGGSQQDQIDGIAVDSSFNVYATGYTWSTDFPVVTSSAFQPAHSTNPGPDVFVAEFDPTGANLLYSSYFGGNGSDQVVNLALPSPGIVGIVGQTNSTDLPTANAFQPFLAGGTDGFFAKFDLTRSGAASLRYATYLGGGGFDAATGLAFDAAGNAYIGGYTFSSNFPTTTGVIQGAFSGVGPDAFALKLQSNGLVTDLATAITASASPVAAGQPYTYTITVTNNGPSTSGGNNVRVFDALPSNVTLVGASGALSSGGSFACAPASGAGARVQCNVGLLPYLSTATVTLTVTASVTPPATSAVIGNTAFATGDDDDPNTANNAASMALTAQIQSDLQIASLAGPVATVAQNTQFQYVATVFNAGPSDATGVTLTDTLPSGVSFVSGTACSAVGSDVTCTVGNLNANAFAQVSYTVSAANTGIFANTASVASTQVIDSVPGNNSKSVATTVGLAASNVDLQLTVTANTLTPVVGGSVIYSFKITNNGPNPATGATLTVPVPAGMSVLGTSYFGSLTGVTCTSSVQVTCTVPAGQLPGPSGAETVLVTMTAGVAGSFTTTATVNGPDTDPFSGNNTAGITVSFGGSQGGFQVILGDVFGGAIGTPQGPTGPNFAGTPGGAFPFSIVTANGRLFFAANNGAAYLSVYDLSGSVQREITRIHGVAANSLAMASDGSRIVAVGPNVDTVWVIDASTFAVQTIDLDGKVGDVTGTADIRMSGVVVVGTKAYINTNSAFPIVVVDFGPATPVISTVSGTTGIGIVIDRSIAATPDGSTVVALRVAPAEMLLIGTATNTVTKTVPLGNNPRAIVITADPNSPSGVFGYLARRNPTGPSDIVSAVDLRLGSSTFGSLLSSTADIGFNLINLALSSDGIQLVGIGAVNHVASFAASAGNLLFLNSYTLNNVGLRAITLAPIAPFSAPGAPIIDSVVPAGCSFPCAPRITNESPKTVRILGSGFKSGAMVRIGNLEPLPSTLISSAELRVTVPQGAAVQDDDVVVTLPNLSDVPAARQISGRGKSFRIDPPPSFTPSNVVVTTDVGSGTLSEIFQDSSPIPAGPRPRALALSTDGRFAYFATDALNTAWAFNFANLDNPAAVPGNTGPLQGPIGSNDGIAVAPDAARGGLQSAYFASPITTGLGFAGSDLQLTVVDVDPSSATRNTVLRTIALGQNDLAGLQGLAANPLTGRYVYVVYDAQTSDIDCCITRLAVFDAQAGTASFMPVAGINAGTFQAHIHVTPDAQSLLMEDANGNINVYDIGANPLSPALVTTITGSGAANPAQFGFFQVLGSRLFAYDSDQHFVQAFNFNRSTGTYTPLGAFTIPGPATLFLSPMVVTPDGKFVYVASRAEDSVAVLDANLLASNNPNPLITKIRTGIGPVMMAASARASATADVELTTDSGIGSTPGTLNQEVFLPVFLVSNNGPQTATNVTFSMPIPAGTTLNTAYMVNRDGPALCTGTTTIACSIGTLPPLSSFATDSRVVEIFVAVTPTTTGNKTLTATVTSGAVDPVPSNNSVAQVIALGSGVDLAVKAGANVDPVALGGQVTYTITVTNNGPQAATNVSAFFGSPLLATSLTPSQGSCPAESPVCALGPINSGASATITVVATITSQTLLAAIDGAVTSTVSVFDAGTSDPAPLNNFAEIVTHLVAGATATEFLFTGNSAAGELHVTDLTTNTPAIFANTIFGGIAVGLSPDDILISPNRHLAFVAQQASYISVVDLTIRHLIQRIRLEGPVHRIAMTPDGSRLLAAPIGSDNLDVMDLTRFPFQVTQRINLNGVGGNPALPAGQLAVADLLIVGAGCSAANLSACKVYIATENGPNFDTNPALNIIVLNLGTSAISTVPGSNAGIGFFGGKNMAALPDGSAVIVAQETTDTTCVAFDRVIRIATNSDTITGGVSLPDQCDIHGLAVGTTPNGVFGYTTTWLDAPEYTQRGILQLNVTPAVPTLGNSIAITPQNQHRVVLNSTGAKLYATNNSVLTTTTPANVFVVDTALLNSNTAQTITQFRAGEYIQALGIGFVDLLPEPGAASIVVSDVNPKLLINDVSNTLTITGSGFAADSAVKVGTLDPMPATFISGSQLQVTLPAGVASQGDLSVVVTNPNTAAPLRSQFISGALDFNGDSRDNGLQIITPLSFQAKYEVAAVTNGDSDLTILHSDRRSKGQNFLLTNNAFWPLGLAYSPDGSTIYVPSFGYNNVPASTAVVTAVSPSQNFGPATSVRVGATPNFLSWGVNTIAEAPNPANGNRPVAYFVTRQSNANGGFDRLNLIDANPLSPAAGTVVDSIADTTTAFTNRNQVGTLGLATTPDGRYVYSSVVLDGRLVIYDTLNHTVSSVPSSSLNLSTTLPLFVTSDGRQLLGALVNTSGQITGIGVFDINSNPLSPVSIRTVTGATPPNMKPPVFTDYKVVGARLYAYDPEQNLVEAFTYSGGGASVNFVNYFAVNPNLAYPGGAGTLAVTPDEALIYISHQYDDSVSVLDANKLVTSARQNDPAVFITRMGTGVGPNTLAINPVRLNSAPVDEAVTISHTPDPIPLGGNITYTITIANNSAINANGGGMVINLDPSLTLQYASVYDPNWLFAQFVFCSGTTQILCSFGQNRGGNCSGNNCDGGLPANFSTPITIIATTSRAGAITTTAAVGGNSFDSNPANNTAQDLANVASADLSIAMTPSPAGEVAPGANLTYTVTVTNNGPSAATGITVTDNLPSNLTLVNGGGCTGTSSLVCSVSSLQPNTSATLLIVVTPNAPGTVTNTVTVQANEPDPNAANNTATATNSAVAADLQVTAAALPTLADGSPAYSATVTNLGPSAASNVVFTDLLDNYGFVSASATQGSCTFAAPTVTCQIGSLPVNATATITVAVAPPKAGWAANVFHASATEPDTNPVNNAVRVGPAPDSFNTPPGSNVVVAAADTLDSIAGSVTFDSVTRAGSTTMGATVAPLPTPSGYRFGRAPLVFDLSTSATFAGTIAINLQFPLSNFHHPAMVRLLHFEGSAWVDRTVSVNPATGTIAGRVASLSPFLLVEPLDNPPLASAGSGYSVTGMAAAGNLVTLDGSASTDADGDSLTYRWTGPFPENGGVVTGAKPAVTLPVGVSKVLLVVNDGEMDSAPVSVSVAVSDFTLTMPVGAALMAHGQSTSYTINVGSLYGAFGAPVNLACSSTAADLSCSLSASSVTPGANGATAVLTVTANPKSAALSRRFHGQFALWLGALPLFGIVFLAAGPRKRRSGWLALLLLLLILLAHLGCGGGGATQTQPSSSPTPAARSSIVTVTGTSGSLQHASSVTVTVSQ